jgi:hypothetical protein
MNYVLADFSSKFNDSLYTAINTILRSMTPQATSNIVYSLSKIGFSWNSLPKSTQIALESSILQLGKSLNNIGISTILYALGKMAAIELDPNVTKLLMHEVQLKSVNMTGLEMANSVYGLGLLFSDFDDAFKRKLVISTSTICKTMTEQELGNTLWGLGNHKRCELLTLISN